MLKKVAQIAEKCAKSSNKSSEIWLIFHQPKKPIALIKKD